MSAPDTPREVCYAAAVVFEGKSLVTGGSDKALECLSAVLEYDRGVGSWKELPGLLTARYDCAVSVLEGDVVVVGGWQASGHTSGRVRLVERYSCRLQRWGAMPSLPGPPAVGRDTCRGGPVPGLSRPLMSGGWGVGNRREDHRPLGQRRPEMGQSNGAPRPHTLSVFDVPPSGGGVVGDGSGSLLPVLPAQGWSLYNADMPLRCIPKLSLCILCIPPKKKCGAVYIPNFLR